MGFVIEPVSAALKRSCAKVYSAVLSGNTNTCGWFYITMMVIIFRIDLFVQEMNINEQSSVIGVYPSVLGRNKLAI